MLCALFGIWCAVAMPQTSTKIVLPNTACVERHLTQIPISYCSADGEIWAEQGTTCHAHKTERQVPICGCQGENGEISFGGPSLTCQIPKGFERAFGG